MSKLGKVATPQAKQDLDFNTPLYFQPPGPSSSTKYDEAGIRVHRTLIQISSVRPKGDEMLHCQRCLERVGQLWVVLLGCQTRTSHQTRNNSEACSLRCVGDRASFGQNWREKWEGKIFRSLAPFFAPR
jgi:hypothetical protein